MTCSEDIGGIKDDDDDDDIEKIMDQFHIHLYVTPRAENTNTLVLFFHFLIYL